MGRHRDTGADTRPVLLSGEQARSHRRPPGVARARAVSLVAAGALAGGIAVVSTTLPWSREASDPQPEARPDGQHRPPGTEHRPGVLPVPPMSPPTTEEPVESAAVPAPAPTLAPPTSTEPPVLAEAPASTLWRADGPHAFLGTSWNTVGAMPPQVNDDEVSFELTGRGQRSELEPALPAVQEGDQHDVTFSVRLDGEFSRGPTARQVIARWENDSPGQAPLDLRVSDGELVLHGGEGHPSGPRTFTRTLGRAPIGEWTQLRVLVRFSADPQKAGVSVWRDGRSVVDDDHPRGGTLYPGQQSYLKVGLHRDRTITPLSRVRFAAWRIDHGRAAAHPERTGPSRDDTPAAVRQSSGPSDDEPRSTLFGAANGASESSARDESDRDAAQHTPTIQQHTSPNDGSDREESDDGPSSERRSTGSSDPERSTSQSDTSHRPASERSSRHVGTNHRTSSGSTSVRERSEENSTSDHRSEPTRRTAPHDPSSRGASEDPGSRQGSSRDGASTDIDAGRSDDSGRSSDG